MNSSTLPIAVPVSRPFVRRLLESLLTTPQDVRRVWQRWQQRRDDERTLAMLAELDEHTLRDIGAPQELRAYVAARQASAYERFEGLMR